MTSPSTFRRNRAFTLLEILVTTTIFTILIGLGLFMSMETFRGTIHRSERDVIVSFLEKARSRAMANIDQVVWGVCYIKPNYVIFKDSYVCDTAHAADSLKANTVVASDSDFEHDFPVVVFSQLSGTTTAASISVLQNERSSSITINHEGTISW